MMPKPLEPISAVDLAELLQHVNTLKENAREATKTRGLLLHSAVGGVQRTIEPIEWQPSVQAGGPVDLLCERSQRDIIRRPLMVGAPLVIFSDVNEGLAGVQPGDRRLLEWSVRETHHDGRAPMLTVTDGVASVSSLKHSLGPAGQNQINGWVRPVIGKA